MTMKTLLLTCFVGGGLAMLIAIAAAAAIAGMVTAKDVITAAPVGPGSGLGLFLLFRGRLGESSY